MVVFGGTRKSVPAWVSSILGFCACCRGRPEPFTWGALRRVADRMLVATASVIFSCLSRLCAESCVYRLEAPVNTAFRMAAEEVANSPRNQHRTSVQRDQDRAHK